MEGEGEDSRMHGGSPCGYGSTRVVASLECLAQEGPYPSPPRPWRWSGLPPRASRAGPRCLRRNGKGEWRGGKGGREGDAGRWLGVAKAQWLLPDPLQKWKARAVPAPGCGRTHIEPAHCCSSAATSQLVPCASTGGCGQVKRRTGFKFFALKFHRIGAQHIDTHLPLAAYEADLFNFAACHA
eukprot:6203794-Pleurochrysis_carterae.AAC.4